MESKNTINLTKDNSHFQDKKFVRVISIKDIKDVDGASFVECIFEQNLFIRSCEISVISFIDCTFNKGVYFFNNKINDLSITDSKILNNLDIVRNKIGILSIDESSVLSTKINSEINIILLNSLKANYLQISKIEIRDKNLKEFGLLRLCGDSLVLETIFESTDHEHTVEICEGIYDRIIFNGVFKAPVNFKDNSTIKLLHAKNSIYENSFRIESGKYDSIFLNESVFKSKFVISDSISTTLDRKLIIHKLQIKNSSFEKECSLIGIFIKDVYISDVPENTLLRYSQNEGFTKRSKIKIAGIQNGKIILESLKCNLKIEGNNFGFLALKNLDSKYLVFQEFQNYGITDVSDIIGLNCFEIENSDLGSASIKKISFETKEKYKINDSIIKNVKFSGYPSLHNSLPKGKNKNVYYRNKRLTYSQLKEVAFKKGDFDTALLFKSKEYSNLLREKRFSRDNLLLFLNYLSNNHGSDWFRGIVFTFVVGIIIFAGYVILTNLPLTIKSLITQYIQFMATFPQLKLPIHENLIETWKLTTLIWIGRIAIGYGIYQTITAFRKFGKL